MHDLGIFFKNKEMIGEIVFVCKKLAKIQYDNRLALMEVEILFLFCPSTSSGCQNKKRLERTAGKWFIDKAQAFRSK